MVTRRDARRHSLRRRGAAAARGLAEAARTSSSPRGTTPATDEGRSRPHSTRRKRRLVGAARRRGPAASRGSSREREPRSADARRCGSSTSPSPAPCPAAPQCRLGSLARRLEKHSPPSGFARPRYSALHARPAGHCPGIISILGHNAFERQFWLQCAGFQSSCERAAGYVPCTANECSLCRLRPIGQRVRCGRTRETPGQCNAVPPRKRMRTDRGLDRELPAAPPRTNSAHVFRPAPRGVRTSRARLLLTTARLHLVEFPAQQRPPTTPRSWSGAVAHRCRSVAFPRVERSSPPSASSRRRDHRSAADDWREPARARSARAARRRR